MGIYLLIAKRLGAFEALCDGDARRPGSALGAFTRARDRVPLDPDRDHLPLRVQLLERAELADRRAHAQVVLAGDPRPRHAGGAQAVAEGGARSRPRSRSCSGSRPALGAATGSTSSGKEAVSFLFVLPIALPGIITGMALNSFFVFWKVNFGLWTIVIGHATFCVVVVYNNVLARLRRVPGLADGGVDGPRGRPAADLVARDAADDLDGAHLGRACSRSRSRSTR